MGRDVRRDRAGRRVGKLWRKTRRPCAIGRPTERTGHFVLKSAKKTCIPVETTPILAMR